MSAGPPSSSFCVLPWMHVFADEAGTMWPCCRAIGSGLPNRDDRSDDPRTIHDAAGPTAGLDTKTMRDIRRAMLAGERPPVCERCYMVEDLGMRSHHQVENATWAAELPALVAATRRDGGLTADIRTADLRLGNLCNLRCRMCSPQSSRALIPEWAERFGIPSDHRHFAGYRAMDWFEDAAFWRLLEQDAPRLGRINFAGGEPLLIAGMADFLERMAASGRAAAMTISYNTNLTVLPDRVLALWPAFAAIRVTVSLDALGPLKDFSRHPSRWEVIDAHLRRLDRDSVPLNLAGGLATNTAVEVYNVFGLGDLLDYLARTLTRFEVPNLSIVTHPEHLSVRILPPALKALATERLRAAISRSSALWRDRWGEAGGELIAAVEGVITYMNGEDRQDLLPQFLDWTRHQDRYRNQATEAAVVELAPLFQ